MDRSEAARFSRPDASTGAHVGGLREPALLSQAPEANRVGCNERSKEPGRPAPIHKRAQRPSPEMKVPFALFLLLQATAFTPLDAAESPVFFRASFDGGAAATLRGQPLAPVREEKASFEDFGDARGVKVGEGTVIEYDLGD